MRTEQPGSKPAKMLYRPLGLVSSIAAGVIAGKLSKQVWKRATPGDSVDAPKALESEWRLREVVLAAAVEGALFAGVKALVDRSGARVFQRWTGEWPGD